MGVFRLEGRLRMKWRSGSSGCIEGNSDDDDFIDPTSKNTRAVGTGKGKGKAVMGRNSDDDDFVNPPSKKTMKGGTGKAGGILLPNADDNDCEDIGEKGIEEPDFDLFVSYDDLQLEGRLGMKWRSGSSGCIGQHDACQNMSAMVLVVFLSVQHCLCQNLY